MTSEPWKIPVNAPVLTTKLYAPTPRADLVSRPRLVTQLTDGLTRKLSLICAPAGYGKTTLLSDWLHRAGRPVAWYSVDEDDNDPARFLEYLIAALESILPKLGEVIPKLPPAGDGFSFHPYLTILINEISKRPGDFLLVLDDYHAITDSEVHLALAYILNNLPVNLHIVIATRTDPPLKIANFRAKGDLCEIRAQDLRFTQTESELFLNQSIGLGLEPVEIESLVNKTEGWITGLQLAAISLQSHPDKKGFVRVFAGDDRYIADYLLDEALERLQSQTQRFLLQTSILDRLNASLCDAITERNDSRALLASLESANLFLIALDNQRNWYRYHHLFASLLRSRLQAAMPQDIPQLHQKAADWYLAYGLVNKALHHAIQSDDADMISNIFEKNMISAATRRDRMDLVRWAKRQPGSLLAQNPWICIAVAYALTDLSQFSDVERYLETARSAGFSGARLDCHIAFVRASLANKQGALDLMARYARDAFACLDPSDIQLRSMISTLLAKDTYWSGDLVASEETNRRIYEDSLTMGDYDQAVLNLADAGQLKALRGSTGQGINTLNEAIDLAEKIQRNTGQPVLTVAYAYLALADILMDTGELGSAYQHIQKGLQRSELWGQPEKQFMGYLVLHKYLWLTRDLDGARQALQKSKEMATLGGARIRSDAFFTSFEVRLHILKGEISAAAKRMEKLNIHAADQITYEKHIEYQALAELLIAKGDYENAILLLENLILVCSQAEAAVHTMNAQISQAIAHFHNGDLESALASLSPALDLAAAEGLLVQDFVDKGKPMAQLLYQACLKGIHPDFCNKLLARFSDAVADGLPPKSPELSVEPLSERELEVLQVIAEGCSNKEISQRLYISLATVKSHTHHIFGKLGVKNRTEAVAKARLLGILPPS